MKVERRPIDLTLPVPTREDAGRSFVSKSPKTRSAYDAAGVIDTVEIRRNDFHIMQPPESSKRPDAHPQKGLFIDLWA